MGCSRAGVSFYSSVHGVCGASLGHRENLLPQPCLGTRHCPWMPAAVLITRRCLKWGYKPTVQEPPPRE